MTRMLGVRRFPIALAAVLISFSGHSGAEDGVQSQGVRGVIKAEQEAVISVDIKASILALPLKTGESFARGDLLISFDCESQQAESAAARAAYKAADSRYETTVEMNNHDGLGALDVSLAKAEMDEASARVRAAEARNRQCRILAPYAGRVAELSVNVHEMPAPDTPLMKIVGSQRLELRLSVPSNWLSWLKIGGLFQFHVDETGRRHEARVTSLGAEVDAASRTVAIVAAFATVPESVLPGMSGTAYFAQASRGQSASERSSDG